MEIIMLKIKTLTLLLLISASCIQASRAPGGPAMSNHPIPARNLETPGQRMMREQRENQAQQVALAVEARRQEAVEAARAKGSADRDSCDKLCASLGLTRKAMIFDMEQTNDYSSRGSSEKGFIKQCVCE